MRIAIQLFMSLTVVLIFEVTKFLFVVWNQRRFWHHWSLLGTLEHLVHSWACTCLASMACEHEASRGRVVMAVHVAYTGTTYICVSIPLSFHVSVIGADR